MAVYVIADITVHDPETYEEYRRQVPAVIEKYGGHYLVRGGAFEVFEGEWQPGRGFGGESECRIRAECPGRIRSSGVLFIMSHKNKIVRHDEE